MTDAYYLWRHDIEHRKTSPTLSDVKTNSTYIATAVIEGVTTNSEPKMSQWDAYFDLRNKVLNLNEFDCIAILPKATTTELSVLLGIVDGRDVLNITTGRVETCLNESFISSAGEGTMAPSAFGDIYENNENGSAINSTTKRWVTATVRNVDANGIVTFEDNSTGDRLVIGSGGAGTYSVFVKCDQTNAGGKITTMTVQVNGVDTTLVDEHASDSGDHRPLYAAGTLILADDDYLSMHVVSSTPSDVITAYHTSIFIQRLS